MHKNRFLLVLLSFIAVFLTVQADAAETAVVAEGKINVRGKPSFVGEVITQLERGEKVTVLERVTAENSKPGEPTNWARIKLPENTPAWVFAPFVKDNKVSATRLNLRAGPGERFSVIGRLSRGDEIKPIRTVADWIEIQAPEDAYAFIDLSLVTFDGTNAPSAAPAVANAPVSQPQDPTVASTPPEQRETQPALVTTNAATETVATTQDTTSATPAEATPQPAITAETPAAQPEQPAVVKTPKVELATEPAAAPTNNATATIASTPETSARETRTPSGAGRPDNQLPQVANAPPRKVDSTAGRRIVRREGIVAVTKSIQAPTWYQLVNTQTGKTINYLYDSKLGLKLKDYRGQKVAVSGEEAIDPRWPETPILDLETLDVLP